MIIVIAIIYDWLVFGRPGWAVVISWCAWLNKAKQMPIFGPSSW